MKITVSSRGLFAIGFALIVTANIVVLSGVARNRSGARDAHVTLTERELPPSYRMYKENSGLSLRIAWRALGKTERDNYYPGWHAPAWLDAEKLETLGFDIDRDMKTMGKRRHFREPLPKEVYIVLEYDGDAYREALKRAETAAESAASALAGNREDKNLQTKWKQAEDRLKGERFTQSRLFAVDAGLDPGALRAWYPDRTRFIIARGLIKPGVYYWKKKKEIRGTITHLSVRRICVPLKFRGILRSAMRYRGARNEPPRYTVAIAYGHRMEPWIVSVRKTGGNSG